MWWLARTPHGSRFLLIYTCGVAGAHGDVLPLHPAHAVADDIIQYGHTLHTFASGFHCMVFSKDTSQLHPPRRLRKMHDLRPYSLFLGVNYVINIVVAGEDVAPGYLTRRRCSIPLLYDCAELAGNYLLRWRRIPQPHPAAAMAVREVHELSCIIELMMRLNFICGFWAFVWFVLI
jgi:hypothetical protein